VIISWVAVELGREESRSALEDLVGPSALFDLALQALHLLAFGRRQTRPSALVTLDLVDPGAKRLG
jgi:hypothetical protein